MLFWAGSGFGTSTFNLIFLGVCNNFTCYWWPYLCEIETTFCRYSIKENEMSQEAENKIVVKNLSKTFDMYNSPMDKLKEALSPRGKIRHTEFHALTDLSLM